MAKQQYKAVALLSGGLDSTLAVRVLQDQSIHVEAINFYTGFCVEGHTHAIRRQDQNKVKRNNALWAAEQLGIKLHIIDVIEEYKPVLLAPRHGYGSHLNPCLDCKSFMVGKALHWMQEHDFDFIITGEVIGQRPMSQRRDTLPVVARESGAQDRLLRPLCAKLLPPTLPEREGWVDRERLHAFNGRSRKPQMALAQHYKITDYAQPAGGCCFLTDASYSHKLADLWQARHRRDYELDDIMLLKVGRHLRPSPDFKMIIGREEGENNFLEGYRHAFIHLRTPDCTGPLVLIDGQPSHADLELAARITARYCKNRDQARVRVQITPPDAAAWELDVAPLAADAIPAEWLL